MRIKIHDSRSAFAKDQIVPQTTLDVFRITTLEDYVLQRMKYIRKWSPGIRYILLTFKNQNEIKITMYQPFMANAKERFWSRTYTKLDD